MENFCFNERCRVSLFHLATGKVGRGKKMEKASIFFFFNFFFLANLGHKENWGSVFSQQRLCWKLLSSSARLSPKSGMGDDGTGDSGSPGNFFGEDFCDFERCKSRIEGSI